MDQGPACTWCMHARMDVRLRSTDRIGSTRRREKKIHRPPRVTSRCATPASTMHAWCMCRVVACKVAVPGAHDMYIHPKRMETELVTYKRWQSSCLPGDRSACLACFVNPPGLSFGSLLLEGARLLSQCGETTQHGRIYTLQGPSCLDWPHQ